ncbi:PREDICTED: uncharacterized protein LOC106108413, partial [Papilio polytes]|uniref:uncharacterized protein LOC106108413 n=1 Tax=Papilio polytes TaxID=76194 RepID=UPI0006766D2B
MTEGNGIPPSLFSLVVSTMNSTRKDMAPSPRRPLNGTGVLRISGGKSNKLNKTRIGTWNVRGMRQPEKLPNIIKEMDRLKLDILGLSDTKWPGQNKYHTPEGKILYYSGSDQQFEPYGVGVLMNKETSRYVTNFLPLSNRAMLVQLNAYPVNINIIVVYAPTADKPIIEIEEFYGQIDTLMQQTRKHDITLLIGDLNAKVGSTSVPGVTGSYGLGSRNDRGDILVEFCQDKELTITNTLFKLHPRRLYTWTSPRHNSSHIMRNQIDYIIINRRFRNSIKNAVSYPGADINSDHNPVVVTLQCKFKHMQKCSRRSVIDTKKLKEHHTRAAVSNSINQWAQQQLDNIKSPLVSWSNLKEKVADICHSLLAPNRRVKKQQWMTAEILEQMEERRMFKIKDPSKYAEINKVIKRKIKIARNNFYKDKCDRIEHLLQKHDNFNLHKEVKELAGLNKKPNFNILCDDHGRYLVDRESKKRIWSDYIMKMFADTSRSISGLTTDDTGPPILTSEVKRALRVAKTGKALGPDNVPIEVLKLLEDDYLEAITRLFNQVYESGMLPEDWLRSTFITLPKKAKAKKCSEYRTISLMSHVLKVFLAIIHDRIRPLCDEQLGESQFGFRSGMGTREALFALNVLVQKCQDMQID